MCPAKTAIQAIRVGAAVGSAVSAQELSSKGSNLGPRDGGASRRHTRLEALAQPNGGRDQLGSLGFRWCNTSKAIWIAWSCTLLS